MSDKILVATDPDDTTLQGIRIAHVNLTSEQSSCISSALFQTTLPHNIINYVWTTGESVDWLLDKISKCNLIFFNADSPNELIAGWMAAQHNSYYFGTLRDLHLANDRVIYNSDNVLSLLESISKQYGKT